PQNIVGTKEQAICFLDLKDGRTIGFTYRRLLEEKYSSRPTFREEWWIVAGWSQPGIQTSRITIVGEAVVLDKAIVIARGVHQFFKRILEANGRYYFD